MPPLNFVVRRHLKVCDTPKSLSDFVASRTLGGGLVIIEGASGSGKTTIAMHLAKELNAYRVSSDCYIDADAVGPYVSRVKLDFLRDDISRLSKSFPALIFEGICARDTLDAIELEPAASVYVRRLSTSGRWPLEAQLEDFLNGRSRRDREPFHSDHEYHVRVRPHEIADAIYTVISD